MLKMDSKTRKKYCNFKRQEMGKKVKIYTTEIPGKSDALVKNTVKEYCKLQPWSLL
jgi:hypothetical protein